MKENSRKVLFRRSEHLSHEFSICALRVRGIGHPRRCAPVRARRAHADARRAQHHATRLAHVGRARQLLLPPRRDELTAACKGRERHTRKEQGMQVGVGHANIRSARPPVQCVLSPPRHFWLMPAFVLI